MAICLLSVPAKALPHVPIATPKQQRIPMAAPRRVPLPTGQHITSHPPVLAAVNAARHQRGWPPAAAGSNYAAEACALNNQHCNGVQWGGCGVKPLPGDQYTATIGSAESDGPRGCIEAISYSSFS
jgi:hypothetical protein